MSQAPIIDSNQYPQLITIQDGSGAFVEQFVGAALLALATQNSGPTEPSPTYALMIWADTSANILKIRNTSNNGWISYMDLTTGNILTSAATVSNVQQLPGYVGLDARVTSVAVSVTADYAVLQNASANVKALQSVSLNKTVNIGTTSTDTGVAIVANTWYKIWHVYNSTATSQLLLISSVTSTSPVLPSGYTYYQYVMSIRGTVGGFLYHMRKNDKEQTYVIDGTVLTNYRQIMGSDASDVLSSASVSDIVPPTATKIRMYVYKTTVNSVHLFIGANVNIYTYYYSGNQYEPTTADDHELTLESTNIYYQSNNTSNYIGCIGWTDKY